MAKGVLAHAGSREGERRSALDLSVDRSTPPWRKWRTRSRAARCIRFVETYCRVPMGYNAGHLIKLARFQREMLEELLGVKVRNGACQIPRGNAKTTLWAAVGLWAVADYEDSPQVPLVAQTVTRSYESMMLAAALMIEADDELARRLVVYHANTDRRIWSGWNNGRLRPFAADSNRLQGLNPTVALVDEAQTHDPSVVRAIQMAAGKRPESLVLSIGTPAPDAKGSALFDLRSRMLDGAPLAWVEHAADEGCDHGDRAQWLKANPGVAAGFLDVDAIEQDYLIQPEDEFRMYRLGQWTDYSEASWLPAGAWEGNPIVDVPEEGTECVLAVSGTWTTSVAVVGCTLDGVVFLAWWSDTATDDQLEDVLSAAWDRWAITKLVPGSRVRAGLFRRLADDGLPVEPWTSRTELEAQAATDFRKAIVDARVPNDGDQDLADQVRALVAKATADGQITLSVPKDGGGLADAGRAALMAWWMAQDVARQAHPAIW